MFDVADKNQLLHCECKDRDALAKAVKAGQTAAPFARVPWAVDLSDKPFPGRAKSNGQWANTPLANLGGWFWESGFDKDPIRDLERSRAESIKTISRCSRNSWRSREACAATSLMASWSRFLMMSNYPAGRRAGIPVGMRVFCIGDLSGGIAALNHRLQAMMPSASDKRRTVNSW